MASRRKGRQSSHGRSYGRGQRRSQGPRFLAISLLLLFATSIFFGWHWSQLYEHWLTLNVMSRYPQLFWPLGSILALIVTGIFTKPLAFLRNWLKQSFESDTRMFFAVIGITSLGVLLLVNLDVLVKIVMALGVVWLARFDLRQLKVRGWRQFAILGTVVLMGFLGGGWLHWSWVSVWLPRVNQWLG